MDWRVRVDNELWSKRRDTIIDLHDVSPLALDHETGGIHLWLNVGDGEITDEENKFQQSDPMDIKEYFNGLKEAYRNLALIPCPGRVTIEVLHPVDELPEGKTITEGEVIAQKQWWPTDLDIQYIRQLYREFGWPNAFKKG
ncbi:hypothetical protein EDB82DRAFT_511012 [Fusarium venenatum]|uniref:uncharacterized protein n=1 Tax=Fusarium venenatum TaxID=56646 RepID=UPI001D68E141|nr:hypothetical protein EDB82DRAFT_511012 [Fusarium venenatum]